MGSGVYDLSDCACCGIDEGNFPCDSCHCCTEETTIYQIRLTLSGILPGDGACADCTSFNGTHTLLLDNSSDFCVFRKTSFDYCGYNIIRFQFDPGSCQYLELLFTNDIASVPANTFRGTWDPLNFDCTDISSSTWSEFGATSSSNDVCDFSGASISVTVVSFATVPNTVTASFTSTCPEWSGASETLTYNSGTGRWEGSHSIGGGETIAIYLECMPGGFGVEYRVRLGPDSSGLSCGNVTSNNSTSDYHPFSWGPFAFGTGNCVSCGIGLGDTLEVTITE